MLDLETVACFRAHHEIRFGPKNIAKPPVDRLSSKHPAQSESKKELTRLEDDLLKSKPILKVPLTYLTMRFAAVK